MGKPLQWAMAAGWFGFLTVVLMLPVNWVLADVVPHWVSRDQAAGDIRALTVPLTCVVAGVLTHLYFRITHLNRSALWRRHPRLSVAAVIMLAGNVGPLLFAAHSLSSHQPGSANFFPLFLLTMLLYGSGILVGFPPLWDKSA